MKASGAGDLRQIRTYWPLILILIVVIFVSFIIIYTKVSSPPLFVYYFEETKGLGNSSANSNSPQIATSGNDTYIVWSGKGNEVINMEKISSSSGDTTTPVRISNNSSNSNSPEVAVSGDNVYLVWADSNGTQGKNGNIFFSSSRDKGKSFDKPINLSNNGNSTSPEVAVDGDNVYVVWAYSQNSGNEDVFLSSSRDSGKSFHEPVNLSNNSGNSTNPEVAATSDKVYVVWAESTSKTDKSDGVNLILKSSTDNGTHFTKKTIKKDIDKYTHLPQIAASGDNVYVVGVDRNGTKGENGNIFLSSSRDKGKSFDEPVNLSSSGNSTDPKVAASGNNTYVIWSDSLPEKKEIKYKHIRLVMLGS